MATSPRSFMGMLESLKGIRENNESINPLPIRPALRIKRRPFSMPPSMNKRRNSSGRVRKSRARIERRVRTLKKLIPKADHSTGLEGLFQDTADYILSLQTRARVMQMMVDLLEGSS